MGPLLVKSTSTRYGDTKPRTSFEMKPSAKEVRGWGLSLNTCELMLLKKGGWKWSGEAVFFLLNHWR